jgi:hypothetical protein
MNTIIDGGKGIKKSKSERDIERERQRKRAFHNIREIELQYIQRLNLRLIYK